MSGDFDVSRRGFLKGLMAAAAVTAVAPLLPAIVQAEELVDAVPALPPIVGAGEIWIKSRGVWRFLGSNLMFMYHREIVEAPSLDLDGLWRRFEPPQQSTVNMEIATDPEGVEVIHRTLEQRDLAEIAVGLAGDLDAHICDGWLQAYSHEFEFRSQLVRLNTTFVLRHDRVVLRPRRSKNER